MRPCRHCGQPATSRTGPAVCVSCKARRDRATATDRMRRWRAAGNGKRKPKADR